MLQPFFIIACRMADGNGGKMNLDMSVAFINLLELFLLIGVGALCGRAHLSGRDAQGVLDPPHRDYAVLYAFCFACRQILRPGVCRGYGYGLERPGEKPGSGFLMIQS